jgi:LmeA-like phospholipid-binding
VRRLLAALLVLAVLLLLADRGSALVAERLIAARAQDSADLQASPSVDVGGFPFLTQVLAGRYDDVRLRARGPVAGTPVDRLDVRVTGARVPLRTLSSGGPRSVPVDGLRATVLLSYAALSQQVGRGLRVSAAGDRLRVEGTVEVLGRTLRATATSSVRLADGRVQVRAQEFSSGSDVVDRLLDGALGDRFDLDVPVPALPYGLRLSGLEVQQDGLLLTAASGPTVLTP